MHSKLEFNLRPKTAKADELIMENAAAQGYGVLRPRLEKMKINSEQKMLRVVN